MPSPSFNRKVPFSEKTTTLIDDFIETPSAMDPEQITLTLKKKDYPSYLHHRKPIHGKGERLRKEGGLSGSGGHSIARRKGEAGVPFK